MASTGPTVRDVGERALIERIALRVARAALPPPHGMTPLLGIGDDAAAWRLPAGAVEAATADAMVEGVHFRRETSAWDDVGWKSWASNVSDVAAMGCEPLAGLVTLGLPAALPAAAVDALYDGILAACSRFGGVPLGGDVVASPVAFVAVAMTGRGAEPLLTRAAARPGDAVAVTGPLGASRGGLRLLEEGAALDTPERAELVRLHRRPAARPDAGLVLRRRGILCAMDLSDGLLADLGKLAAASGCAARVVRSDVPAHPALAAEHGGAALDLALAGGEDYELLFTGPPDAVRAALAETGGAVVGAIVAGEPGAVEVVDASGAPSPPAAAGWEHFRAPDAGAGPRPL